MALDIPSFSGDNSGASVSVSEAVFGQPYNETLVHQLVVSYMAGGRAGTKAQKTRSEVSGGGRKPWRQKSTGRARSGTLSSPIWRSGGVTFAAKPRSYAKKVNKKMHRVGMRVILSELLRQGRIVIQNDIAPSAPKTRELVSKLKFIDAKRALIVTTQDDDNLVLASRNLKGVQVCRVEGLDPVSLVSSDRVVLTDAAVSKLEERFG